MLTNNAMRYAQEIVEKLEAQGIRTVIFNTGTLDTLVGASYPGAFTNKDNPVTIDAEQIKQFQRESGHGSELDGLAEMYAKPVIDTIDNLRNKVIPFIDAVAAGVKAKYTEETFAISDIQQIEFPYIYKNMQFLEYIGQHAKLMNSQAQDVRVQSGFMDRSEDDIMQLLRSGSTTLDDAIVDMIARYPSNWLVDTYRKYFVDGMSFPTAIDVGKQHQIIDELIVAYFIHASFLANDTIDSTINIPLNQYKDYLVRTFAQLGGLLNRYINNVNVVDEGGIVVAYRDVGANIVYVYKRSFELFIERGGNADAVLGAVAANTNTHINFLLENSERLANEFNKAYNDHISNVQANFRSTFLKLFVPTFIEELGKQPSEFIALFLDPKDPNPNANTAAIAGRITGQLQPAQGAPDIYTFTRLLVLNIGLNHWPQLAKAYTEIQRRVDEAKIDPRMATYQYVLSEIVSDLVNNYVVVKETDIPNL